MPKLYETRSRGSATVAQRFSIPVAKGKLGTKARSQGIAGCRVTTGVAERAADVRVVRDGVEVWKGKLEALKQQKEDKDTVPRGQECGLAFDGWDRFEVEDVVEFTEQVEIQQHLGS
jgi:translation initiation factor IF-2